MIFDKIETISRIETIRISAKIYSFKRRLVNSVFIRFYRRNFMSERRSLMGTKSWLRRNLTQHPMTGSIEEIAVSHETNRQSVVKEILVHVFLMAKFRILLGGVTVGEARAQYFRATAANQAAHNAPGQIFSNGTPIQNLITTNDDLQVTIDNLFGTTDNIHANFNMADSSSEANGLRDAFGVACNEVAGKGKYAKFNRAHEFHRYIESAFLIYKNQGANGFRAAIASQRNLMNGATGSDLAARQDRLLITQTYLNTLNSASPSLETVLGLYTEDLWREYR